MEMKKQIAFLALIGMISSCFSVSASTAYQSYAYSYTDEGVTDVASPQAYLPKEVYTASNMGITLGSPEDLIMDNDGNVYICDASTNQIEVLSPGFEHIRTISSFDNHGATDTFQSPHGIFIDSQSNLYIADSLNNRVVVLDSGDQLVRIIGTPQSDILGSDFAFIPLKVLVDSSSRLFVLSKNENSGIMQFTESGNFIGFVGSNDVVVSPLLYMWKKIMTNEQKSKLESFVPVEYSNISLDYKGFIYAVTAVSDVDDPIRRLNPSGNDILVRNPLNGSESVSGDVLYAKYDTNVATGPSAFTDISSDDKGDYYALDSKRGRIFGYDEDGNMLFVFGSLNTNQKGSFVSPSAIQYYNGYIYALDRSLCEIIVFEPTEYTNLMQEAMAAYIRQDFAASFNLWEEVIKLNGNFDLAYMKAGYSLYRLQDYEEAMKYFKLVNAKEAYSGAYVKYKKEMANQYFDIWAVIVISAAAVLVVGLFIVRRIHKKRKGK